MTKNTPSASSLRSIGECIQYGAEQFEKAELFFGHGTDNAEDEAFWLTFYALDLPFDTDASVLEQKITEVEWDQVNNLFLRRVTERVPAAYITGEAWFCGHPFTVNEHVLVPRSPIAELIVQQYQPWLSASVGQPLKVLDMCTGCGCIGIATALHMPDTLVDISDISTEALQVAQENILHHKVQDRVTAIQSDVFNGLPGNTYDLIVTNPPYVDKADIDSMPAEYQAEPAIALGSGDDGLDITRRLLKEAANYLNDNGVMIVEVGNSWENVEAAFPNVPFMWLGFESGGHGVFVITKQELLSYQADFI
ncbi:MAG: ribosomal protein L3 glutamine methyltransferase [Candidatus Endobugula sp.]|jgi:ribosomal protein L3 glutamine methyltransferase